MVDIREMVGINRVAIVGAGAVGGYYGARLAESGMDVSFLLRSDYAHVKSHGFVVESVAGDFGLADVQCAETAQEIGPVYLVIVAWKTTSNRHYEEVIAPLLHAQSLILTLQNGLGNVEKLGRIFGSERIFGGLCFVCINRIGPGRISHTASGLMRVGEYRPDVSNRLTRLVDLLQAGGIDCHAVENLEGAQWMKLIWNVPFNGLAIAEGGVDTRVLLGTPGMEDRIRRIMREVQAVALALGHGIADEFIEKQIAVTRLMEGYRPSSMIDYLEGREVEVDAIWREPVRQAYRLGVEVPQISELLAKIELRLEERGN
jgi:2-dehydropantoate 2-reductase